VLPLSTTMLCAGALGAASLGATPLGATPLGATPLGGCREASRFESVSGVEARVLTMITLPPFRGTLETFPPLDEYGALPSC
jgi:hypothetical protein